MSKSGFCWFWVLAVIPDLSNCLHIFNYFYFIYPFIYNLWIIFFVFIITFFYLNFDFFFLLLVWKTSSEPSWKPHTPTPGIWPVLCSLIKDFKAYSKKSRARVYSLMPSWLPALEDGWCLEKTTTLIARYDGLQTINPFSLLYIVYPDLITLFLWLNTADQHVPAVQNPVRLVSPGCRERSHPGTKTRPFPALRHAGLGHRLVVVWVLPSHSSAVAAVVHDLPLPRQ